MYILVLIILSYLFDMLAALTRDRLSTQEDNFHLAAMYMYICTVYSYSYRYSLILLFSFNDMDSCNLQPST